MRLYIKTKTLKALLKVPMCHHDSYIGSAILEVDVSESFDSFVARLSSQMTAKDAVTRGVTIEHHSGARGDGPATTSNKHILTMGLKRPSRFEIRHRADYRVSYIRQPGSLTLVPSGACPLIRAETEFDLVGFALDSPLVNALDSELEHRPKGDLHLRINLKDPSAQQLMTLLIADSKEGYTTERLYTEHLTQALAARMLFLGRSAEPQITMKRISGLPGHVLRRIVERMRCFSCDLSLESLANESGYSRVHFVRMFRATTGYSPHSYLLNLRLERARELLRNSQRSLIDIALECGFSSHSHMSRLFHKSVGVTPSAYRRSLRP